MKNFKNFFSLKNSKYFYLIILLLIFFVVFHKLFFTGIISYSDYPFFYPDSSFSFFYTWNLNNFGTNQGGVMFTFFTYLTTKITGLIFWAKMGSNIFYFVCILLPYLLIYYLFGVKNKNYLLGFFLSFFFISNLFIFEQIVIWPWYYFIDILSIIFISYNIYRYLINFKGVSNRIILFFIAIIAHPFILLIAALYYIIYLILIYKKDSYKIIFRDLFIIILIHLYWIIPFIYNNLFQSSSEFYQGAKQGLFEWYKSFLNIISILQYKNYPWARWPASFSKLYWILFLCLNILPFFFLIIKKKWLYLLLIYLFFLNLSLGPNSPITGYIREYLFNNFSIFWYFRSYSRRLIVCLFLNIVLISILYTHYKSKGKNPALYFWWVIILLVAFSYKSLFSWDLNWLINSSKLPHEYEKTQYINEKSSYMLHLPNIYYENYFWTINNNYKIAPNAVYFTPYYYPIPTIINWVAYGLDNKSQLFSRIFSYKNDTFSDKDLNIFYNTMPVQYVMIHKDMYDLITNLSGLDNTLLYKQYFDKNNKWVMVMQNDNFRLYKNKVKVNFLFKNKYINFNQINPTKYQLEVKNLKSEQSLSFLQSFHPEWKLYPWTFKDISCDKDHQVNYSWDVTECISDHYKFFQWEEISYLWKAPVFDNTHKLVNEYANWWTIDARYIRQQFPKDSYQLNPDWSIDVKLVLYFRPQSRFYVGLGISGLTLLSLIMWLIRDSNKRRKTIRVIREIEAGEYFIDKDKI